MLRFKHLKRLRTIKNDYKLQANIFKFSDSLRFIANSIETEEERIKTSNEMLNIVQETFHIKHLNSLTSESMNKFHVESFINQILNMNDNNKNIDYRLLADAENIKKIRIYLEKNINSIEKEKLVRVSAKLREMLMFAEKYKKNLTT